jgi:hypothetical protein
MVFLLCWLVHIPYVTGFYWMTMLNHELCIHLFLCELQSIWVNSTAVPLWTLHHVSPSGIDFVRICISGTSIEDLRVKCVEFTSAPVQKSMEFRSLVQPTIFLPGQASQGRRWIQVLWSSYHEILFIYGPCRKSWELHGNPEKHAIKKKTVTDWWFPSPKIASSNTSFHHGTYALTMTCIASPKKIEQ